MVSYGLKVGDVADPLSEGSIKLAEMDIEGVKSLGLQLSGLVLTQYGTNQLDFEVWRVWCREGLDLPPPKKVDGIQFQHEVFLIPGILSVLPPVVAVSLAFLLRDALVAIFVGLWLGGTFTSRYKSHPQKTHISCRASPLLFPRYNPVTGLAKALGTYCVGSLSGSAAIFLFIFLLGGFIGLV